MSGSVDGERIKRNIGVHKISWLSKDGKLFADVGEQIIYTGQNRGIEWHYLNPFVPYFFTALEGDTEMSVEGDNDNSIIFTTIRYALKPTLSIYGALIIDDFQVYDNDLHHGLGYNIVAVGAFDISHTQITWALAGTRIHS